MKAQDHLYVIMKKFYDLFDQEGSGITGGLIDTLKEADVPLAAYVSQVLKEEKYIDYSKSGRTRIHFWNTEAKPSVGMAKQILRKARDLKSGQSKSETKVNSDNEIDTIEAAVVFTGDKKEKVMDMDDLRKKVYEELLIEAEAKYNDLRMELALQKALVNLFKTKL